MIGTRDDLFLYLRKLGVDRKKAYMIMNRVRKGRHLTIEEEAKLRELGAEEWVLDMCSNVKYMFPRAHIAQLIRRDAFCIDESEYELNDNLGLAYEGYQSVLVH